MPQRKGLIFSNIVILARPATPDNEDSLSALQKSQSEIKLYIVDTKSPIDALSFAVLR